MKIGMTLDKARKLVALTVAARKRWGKNAQPSVTMDDLLDALVVVHDAANLDAPSKEEVTLLRRQLAACMNREKARQSKPDNNNVDDLAAPGGPYDHSAD